MTSPYKIRKYLPAGLIESEVRNGYRYSSARELEHIKRKGLPFKPASADLDPEESRDDIPERYRESRRWDAANPVEF
jgi:DNA-binding transcriptional MerR regulator